MMDELYCAASYASALGGRAYGTLRCSGPRRAGTPVVALHGFTGSGADMEALAAELSRALFAFDLPGHGRTPAAPDGEGPSFDAVVSELASLCGDEAPWSPPAAADPPGARGGPDAPGTAPALLGYSMGGRLALALALATPQRFSALVLISASPGLAAPDARRDRRLADAQLAERIESIGAAAFADEWAQHPLIRSQVRTPEPFRTAMTARRAANDARGLAASLRGCGLGQMTPLHDRLPALTLPVLLLTGAEDPRYGAEARAMLERLPRARHVTISDAGHAPHLEAPRRTAEAIERFLRALP
jgi:2-succinyl-6-hydroxy-2,4-cyclohexadiene-1-carboxylate synthase